ncbi:hypothetical protein ABGB18_26105 [Nonomuraea sp. B12E4]
MPTPSAPDPPHTFACPSCALNMDRDVNAVRDLAALVERQVAGSGSET